MRFVSTLRRHYRRGQIQEVSQGTVVSHRQACKEPDCESVVMFDPADPRHNNAGQLLVDEEKRPRIAYLRCGNNHLHRYELPQA